MYKLLCLAVIGAVALTLLSGHQLAAQAQRTEPCAPSISECPLVGCSKHPNDPRAPLHTDLNTSKNRGPGDFPSTRIGPFDVNQFMDPTVLPTHSPAAGNLKDIRARWIEGDQAAQRVRVAENNETALVGYILRAKPGGPESCNCNIGTRDAIDTHVNLIEDANSDADPSQLLGESAIAEITHRTRDPAWTLLALNKMALANPNGEPKPRVRIIGSLTYDNIHWDMLKAGQRGTLWEVHPITEIDVEINGRWVPLTSSNRAAFGMINRLLAIPANALSNEKSQRQGANHLTNSRSVKWTPEQIRALDARMGTDAS